MVSLALFLALAPAARVAAVQAIQVGWHDELERPELWAPLGMENKAHVYQPGPGTMLLGLDHVPPHWPYQYQWSGVTRDARVDLARFPILMARTLWVKGYAHMDIDLLGADGKAIKTLRSSTVNGPGITRIDLSSELGASVCPLRLRLIVGGPNEGCSATYDWVRFIGRADEQRLTQDPDLPAKLAQGRNP